MADEKTASFEARGMCTNNGSGAALHAALVILQGKDVRHHVMRRNSDVMRVFELTLSFRHSTSLSPALMLLKPAGQMLPPERLGVVVWKRFENFSFFALIMVVISLCRRSIESRLSSVNARLQKSGVRPKVIKWLKSLGSQPFNPDWSTWTRI